MSDQTQSPATENELMREGGKFNTKKLIALSELIIDRKQLGEEKIIEQILMSTLVASFTGRDQIVTIKCIAGKDGVPNGLSAEMMGDDLDLMCQSSVSEIIHKVTPAIIKQAFDGLGLSHLTSEIIESALERIFGIKKTDEEEAKDAA